MPHDLPTVHVLYENPDWLPPLVTALSSEGFPVEPHEVWHGLVDPDRPPAAGLWLNRMSPSSHTRGHHESVALMREILAWLEDSGRRVVNGSRAFEIEVSKLRQDRVLRRHGILTPKTILAVGRESLVEAARSFEGPFLTKHNQGGKGLGIHLFHGADELAAHVGSDAFDPGPNGQVVLQQYIQPAEPHVTRVELVGGRFLFAMRSSTQGGFELCPSDVCQAEKQRAQPADVCPADGSATFRPSPVTADDPLVQQYVRLCAAEGIDLAGIEFVEDAEGRRYTYDINANTNYNAVLGREIGVDGMREVARWLKSSASRA
jgi:glutathione synthase/RimK-type ligase-like ATP-grasp enzyme